MRRRAPGAVFAANDARGEVSAVEKKSRVNKKVIWAIISFILAIGSIAAVIWHSRSFKLSEFFEFIRRANPGYIAAAVVCMLLFILFEGEALRVILVAFGNRASHRNCAAYSATDLYFSAITPSSTGGQPACAFMMMRDGIPGSTATVALLANIVMYTSSIFVLGLLAFFLYPSAFSNFGSMSRILIYAGIIAQVCLLSFFILLLVNEQLLSRIVIRLIRIGGKLRLVRRVDERIEKISASLDNYARDIRALRGHRAMLVKVFFLNLAQRASQLAVTMFVHLAAGSDLLSALKVFALQCYVVLGASFVPIPGAMGVTDFLMLDAFGTILPPEAATSLELLSRTLSFYCCILLCAVVVLIRFLSAKKGSASK